MKKYRIEFRVNREETYYDPLIAAIDIFAEDKRMAELVFIAMNTDRSIEIWNTSEIGLEVGP